MTAMMDAAKKKAENINQIEIIGQKALDQSEDLRETSIQTYQFVRSHPLQKALKRSMFEDRSIIKAMIRITQ